MEIDYTDAKDLRDVNNNLKLLIQKYNHEHSNLVNNVSKNTKSLNFLKKGFIEFTATTKAMNMMMKFILGVITSVSCLIGIGVAFS